MVAVSLLLNKREEKKLEKGWYVSTREHDESG
jgi:hypothetical protein